MNKKFVLVTSIAFVLISAFLIQKDVNAVSIDEVPPDDSEYCDFNDSSNAQEDSIVEPSFCQEVITYDKPDLYSQDDQNILAALGTSVLNKTYPTRINTTRALVSYDELPYPVPTGATSYFMVLFTVIFTWYFTHFLNWLLKDVKKKMDLFPKTDTFPNINIYTLQQSRRESRLNREARNTWSWLATYFLVKPSDPNVNPDEVLKTTGWDDFQVPHDVWSIIKAILRINANAPGEGEKREEQFETEKKETETKEIFSDITLGSRRSRPNPKKDKAKPEAQKESSAERIERLTLLRKMLEMLDSEKKGGQGNEGGRKRRKRSRAHDRETPGNSASEVSTIQELVEQLHELRQQPPDSGSNAPSETDLANAKISRLKSILDDIQAKTLEEQERAAKAAAEMKSSTKLAKSSSKPSQSKQVKVKGSQSRASSEFEPLPIYKYHGLRLPKSFQKYRRQMMTKQSEAKHKSEVSEHPLTLSPGHLDFPAPEKSHHYQLSGPNFHSLSTSGHYEISTLYSHRMPASDYRHRLSDPDDPHRHRRSSSDKSDNHLRKLSLDESEYHHHHHNRTSLEKSDDPYQQTSSEKLDDEHHHHHHRTSSEKLDDQHHHHHRTSSEKLDDQHHHHHQTSPEKSDDHPHHQHHRTSLEKSDDRHHRRHRTSLEKSNERHHRHRRKSKKSDDHRLYDETSPEKSEENDQKRSLDKGDDHHQKTSSDKSDNHHRNSNKAENLANRLEKLLAGGKDASRKSKESAGTKRNKNFPGKNKREQEKRKSSRDSGERKRNRKGHN